MLDKPSQKQHMLRLNVVDNVVVAITTVEKGALTSEDIIASERIGKGHKMASANVKAGEPVKKFGQIIGFAKVDIPAGAWIHEHNIGMGELAHDYAFAQGATQTDILPLEKQETFQGFQPRQRKDRHAQLHRHHDQRELFGNGCEIHCRRDQPLWNTRQIIPISMALLR